MWREGGQRTIERTLTEERRKERAAKQLPREVGSRKEFFKMEET